MKIENVLSAFDGSGTGLLALKILGITPNNYFASEIDKYSIGIAKYNHSEIKHIGNILDIKGENLPKIDLMIGGSPCQSFSRIGNGENFYGESGLFYEYVRVLNEVKPKYFFLENVKMKKEWQDEITRVLGVEPVELNSEYYSAQYRERCYWTNIPQCIDYDISNETLYDIMEDNVTCDSHPYVMPKPNVLSRYIPFTPKNVSSIKCIGLVPESHKPKGNYLPRERVFDASGKSRALTTSLSHYPYYMFDGVFRRPTPIECERLQNLPDDYTKYYIDKNNNVIETPYQIRYKTIGDGWTTNVIIEFFKGLLNVE